ncbi:MAG: HDIG domain-containing protein [Endomicrobium sp.]|jgi:putative nucleotidyltransferase with HDIG domain|nr:HDIG domain-containing protein [Endomicrobium sp.]
MNNFLGKIKFCVRGFLLKIARDLGNNVSKGPVVRESKSLFSKVIKIPVFIPLIFTVAAVYCMIVIGFGISYKALFATAIFTTLSVIFFIWQICTLEKMMTKDNDAVVLMCLLFIIAMLMFQILKEYSSPFLSPVATFSLMAAMLLSLRVGILYAVCLSLFIAILNNMRFDIFLVMLCGGIIAVANAQNIRRRSDFINIGAKIAVANIVIVTMFYFFDSYSSLQFKYNLFYSALNGTLAIVLLLVFMPLLEKVFSRTTNIKLIELSDFNNPLLKKLMLEAPGTYHHSIMTADIAEQAANAINDNSLLARVGAYYHDIGKLKNSKYFIENQTPEYNPHDDIAPVMSGLILIAHVKDGVAFARKYNVDNEIINIIEQHHGTTPMYVFYHRALVAMSEDVNIEDFRYPGPKPNTKVAAIVMMADSCEAACRSIEDPTAARIKDTVEKIINNKFIDGQFSKCPVTLKDLETIRDSIISTITGIYHARIEYKSR